MQTHSGRAKSLIKCTVYHSCYCFYLFCSNCCYNNLSATTAHQQKNKMKDFEIFLYCLNVIPYLSCPYGSNTNSPVILAQNIVDQSLSFLHFKTRLIFVFFSPVDFVIFGMRKDFSLVRGCS